MRGKVRKRHKDKRTHRERLTGGEIELDTERDRNGQINKQTDREVGQIQRERNFPKGFKYGHF